MGSKVSVETEVVAQRDTAGVGEEFPYESVSLYWPLT